MPVGVTWWNVSPREDGFSSGSALGKTILGETFHHVTPTGMAYLYTVVLFLKTMILYKTTVQLQGYIESCSVVVSLSVESNVVFAMLYLATNLNVNTMHNYKHW